MRARLDEPTEYADLNALLGRFVSEARAILGPNFCGAYLQGSFAIGDADVHSDVDFLVVTHDEVGAALPALQAMHARLYALEVPWAQHLEGSYAPKGRLRRVDPERAPFLFLDNGASELVWDNHCNAAHVRWVLREHGIVLAGTGPASLVEPVARADLRSEALVTMRETADWARTARTKAGRMSRWLQPYLVLSFCRMLHTLEHAKVVSKREAGEWALGALDADWAELIRRALDDRPDPWLRVHKPAEHEDIRRTLAFVDYALESAPAR